MEEERIRKEQELKRQQQQEIEEYIVFCFL